MTSLWKNTQGTPYHKSRRKKPVNETIPLLHSLYQWRILGPHVLYEKFLTSFMERSWKSKPWSIKLFSVFLQNALPSLWQVKVSFSNNANPDFTVLTNLEDHMSVLLTASPHYVRMVSEYTFSKSLGNTKDSQAKPSQDQVTNTNRL